MWRVLILLLVAIIAGCNTFKGLGKDITQAAEGTERAINGDHEEDQ